MKNKDFPSFGIMIPLDVVRNLDGTPMIPDEQNKVYYVMGVDTYDEGSPTYCLMRRLNGKTEILLSKTIRDDATFKEEVENLVKYFDAITFKETP